MTILKKITGFAREFRPLRTRVGGRERMRAFLGAAGGILCAAFVARWWAAALPPGAAWFAAPLGASAVLVFAVPASPLAQPWAVIGGNVLSACVGAACAAFIGDPAWAGAAAVGLSIALMFTLRCLHPPGGATALLAALGSSDLGFALFPMLVNSVSLVLVGIVYNTLTGRPYPHPQNGKGQFGKRAPRFSDEDLDAALAHYNQVIDVSRGDLKDILHFAEAAGYERRFGKLRCADIMSREPLATAPELALDEAWRLLRSRRVKALPVIDPGRRVVGIVTVADFLKLAGLDQAPGFRQRLRSLGRRDGAIAASRFKSVAQIMTPQVAVAEEQQTVAELVPLFAVEGHHHIPVVDGDHRLIGIITQSDVVRALAQAGPALA